MENYGLVEVGERTNMHNSIINAPDIFVRGNPTRYNGKHSTLQFTQVELRVPIMSLLRLIAVNFTS